MTTRSFFATFFALGGFLAVLLGAMGAHALRGVLDEHGLALWDTASRYHFWHVLALGWIVLRTEHHPREKWLIRSGVLFCAGVILFSGSLYLYALTGAPLLPRITPLGGACLMAGWLALLAHFRSISLAHARR